MVNNLPQIIFDQFLQIVEKLSACACFEFSYCDFDYRVYERVHHKLLDVYYVVQDECKRQSEIVVTIDITNICLEYLTHCKWVDYLEKLANEFIHDICPKRIFVVKEEKQKCRNQTPCWSPFPCKKITTVIRKKIPIVQPETCEVIIQNDCECVPECKIVPEPIKKQIVVKYEKEKPPKCCGRTVYEQPNNKKHDWGNCRGNVDYNDHIWSKKCNCKTGCGGNSNNAIHAH